MVGPKENRRVAPDLIVDARGRRKTSPLVATSEDHSGVLVGQCVSRVQSDAVGRSGDQGRLPVQRTAGGCSHVNLLRFVPAAAMAPIRDRRATASR
jgi:hypothetical protein